MCDRAHKQWAAYCVGVGRHVAGAKAMTAGLVVWGISHPRLHTGQALSHSPQTSPTPGPAAGRPLIHHLPSPASATHIAHGKWP